MALAIKVEQDGSLTITEGTGPGGKGAARAWSVSWDHVAAHRRDPAVEAALSGEQRAQLAQFDAARAALLEAAEAERDILERLGR